MDAERLKEIKARATAMRKYNIGPPPPTDEESLVKAMLILNSLADIPDLLAALEAAEAERDRLRAVVEADDLKDVLDD